MKKFIFSSLFVAIAMTMLMGLSSCDPKNQKQEPSLNNAEEATVENILTLDRQYMAFHYGTDYRWFECSVKFKDYLDQENDGKIEEVTNVFQVVYEYEKDKSYDTYVVMLNHNKGEGKADVYHSFWVEDYVLSDDQIKISFGEAYQKIMECNLPKPHSKNCVLRKEVGPKEANPQYIFGNNHAQLYVDAVTGNVSETNPVFEGYGFKMPLGEWP